MSNDNVTTLTTVNGAYVAGLLIGWSSRLDKNSESTKDVINEMGEFSKFLAIRSGVTLFE